MGTEQTYKFNNFPENDDDEMMYRNYQFEPYQNINWNTLSFPKHILGNAVKDIREFNESQQLYYYLTWTFKMQGIDGEFIHYKLKYRQHTEHREITIFNAELHQNWSNEVLFVVAVLNNGNNTNIKSKWEMNAIMTSHQVYNIYGIDECDLQIGSRYKHKYFRSKIQKNIQRLHKNMHFFNWNRAPLIKSNKKKKYKDGKPDFNDIDLDKAMNESIN